MAVIKAIELYQPIHPSQNYALLPSSIFKCFTRFSTISPKQHENHRTGLCNGNWPCTMCSAHGAAVAEFHSQFRWTFGWKSSAI